MATEPVYYNEFNKDAAAWLRNLINAGHIAHGIVDERSIEDVFPSDLRGFKQCHFFAGIGVWSYALRSAGWSDDRPIWTGSCPCQPFSAAGQGVGFDDERHLWPHFHHLIKQCNPTSVLGEQVASKDADSWIDLVQTDLEALGYAFGAVPFPSAGIGAPHIRDRLYWVADTNSSAGQQGSTDIRGRIAGGDAQPWAGFSGSGLLDGVGHAAGTGPQGGQPAGQRSDAQRAPAKRAGAAGGLANDYGDGCESRGEGSPPLGYRQTSGADSGASRLADAACGWNVASITRPDQRGLSAGNGGEQERATTGPTNGLWRNADWLLCRDGRWRPVEPGTFPLVNGAPARVGRLRGYGNAINAQAARVFIEAVMESL